MSRKTLLAASLLALSPLSDAQTLLAIDGFVGSMWEFTAAPAGACVAPNPMVESTPFGVPVAGCANPFPGVPAFDLGGIANDPLTDTYFVSDGFVIQEYAFEGPCDLPPVGTPLSNYPSPLPNGLPILGIARDATGVTTGGVPAIWCTDGLWIWALDTTLTCGIGPPPYVVAPCFVPSTTGESMLDLTVDTDTGTLWSCDRTGVIQQFAPDCSAVLTTTATGFLGLNGLAFDTATPNVVTGDGPAMFVTDGIMVEYIDPYTGLPAPSTLYAPVPLSPTPIPLFHGLALAQHDVSFGTSRADAVLTSTGQSSTPGPTFALQVEDAPADSAWLILNFSFPGPGLFCPGGAPGAGTTIWVDPTPPGAVIPLGVLTPCASIPLPIPALAPIGVQAYAQIVFLPGGSPPASDATNGLAVTVGAP
jgi:hypothetical protein